MYDNIPNIIFEATKYDISVGLGHSASEVAAGLTTVYSTEVT